MWSPREGLGGHAPSGDGSGRRSFGSPLLGGRASSKESSDAPRSTFTSPHSGFRSPLAPLVSPRERPAAPIDVGGSSDDIVNIGGARHGTALEDPLVKFSAQSSSADSSAWLQIERQSKDLEQAQWKIVNEELARLGQKLNSCTGGLQELRNKFDAVASSRPAQASTQVLEDRISRAVVGIARVDDRVENGLASLSAEIAAVKDQMRKVEDKIASAPSSPGPLTSYITNLPEATEQYSKFYELAQQVDDKISRAVLSGSQIDMALSKITVVEGNVEAVARRFTKLSETAAQLEERVNQTVAHGNQVNAAMSSDVNSVNDKLTSFQDRMAADSQALYAKLIEVSERYAKLSEVSAQMEDRVQKNVMSSNQINEKTQKVLTALSAEFDAIREKIDRVAVESAGVSSRLPEVTERYVKLSESAAQLEEKVRDIVRNGDRVHAALSAEFVAVKETIALLEVSVSKNVTSSDQLHEKNQNALSTEIARVTSYCEERFHKAAVSIAEIEGRIDSQSTSAHTELLGTTTRLDDSISKNAASISHVQDKLENDFAMLRKELAGMASWMEDSVSNAFKHGNQLETAFSADVATVKKKLGVLEGKIATDSAAEHARLDDITKRYGQLSEVATQIEEKVQKNIMSGNDITDKTQNVLAAFSVDFAATKEKLDKVAVEAAAAHDRLPQITERYAKLSEVAAQMEERVHKNIVSGDDIKEKTQKVLAVFSAELAATKDKMDKVAEESAAVHNGMPVLTERYAKLSEAAAQLEDRVNKTMTNSERVNASLSSLSVDVATVKEKVSMLEGKAEAGSATVHAKFEKVPESYAKLYGQLTNVSSELSRVTSDCEERFKKAAMSIAEIEGRIDREITSMHSKVSAVTHDNIGQNAASINHIQDIADNNFATLQRELAGIASWMSKAAVNIAEIQNRVDGESTSLHTKLSGVTARLDDSISQVQEQIKDEVATLRNELAGTASWMSKAAVSIAAVEGRVDTETTSVHAEFSGVTAQLGDFCSNHANNINQLREKVDNDFAVLRKEIAGMASWMDDRVGKTTMNGEKVNAALSADVATVKAKLSILEDRTGADSAAEYVKLVEITERYARLSELAAEMEDKVQKNITSGNEITEKTQHALAAFTAVKDNVDKMKTEFAAVCDRLPEVTDRYTKLSESARQLEEKIRDTVMSSERLNAVLSAELVSAKDKIAAECAAVCAKLPEVTERYTQLSEVAAQLENKFNKSLMSGDQASEKTQNVLTTVSSELAGVTSYCEERFSKVAVSIVQIEGRLDRLSHMENKIDRQSDLVRTELSGVSASLDDRISKTAISIGHFQNKVDHDFTILRKELAGITETEALVHGLCLRLESSCQETILHVENLETRLGVFEQDQNGGSAALERELSTKTQSDYDPLDKSSESGWKMENGKWSKIQESSTKVKAGSTDVTERLQQQALQLACWSLGSDHAEQIADLERRFASRRSTLEQKEGRIVPESSRAPSLTDLQQFDENGGHQSTQAGFVVIHDPASKPYATGAQAAAG